MAKQLSFAAFDRVQSPTNRLFFAVRPDADAAARSLELAQRLRREHGLKGEPIETERLHVTLLYLGDYVDRPEEIVAAASEVAATIEMPRFDVAFDRAVSFSRKEGRLPLVLCGGDGVAPLKLFQQALSTAMMNAGLMRRVEAHSTPHMTLFYDYACVAERAVETIGWRATEFVLVDSLLRERRHLDLSRWSLRDQAYVC